MDGGYYFCRPFCMLIYFVGAAFGFSAMRNYFKEPIANS